MQLELVSKTFLIFEAFNRVLSRFSSVVLSIERLHEVVVELLGREGGVHASRGVARSCDVTFVEVSVCGAA